MKTTNKNHSGVVTATTREVYEGKVAMEAFERAGHNMNLHGHGHEIMYRDMLNANPKNVVNGVEAVLTKSPTAVRDDIVLKQGGKVVGRMQLKDTSNSVKETVKQVKNGHYAGTNLMGTTETVEAYTKVVSKSRTPVTQQMKSTGISSNDTCRIASQVTGKAVTGTMLKQVAKTSGASGAAIGAVVETVKSGADLLDGKINGGEFVGRVAKEATGSGLSAATGSVAATATATAAASVLAATTAPVWVAPAAGLAAAVFVGSAVKSGFDSFTSFLGW